MYTYLHNISNGRAKTVRARMRKWWAVVNYLYRVTITKNQRCTDCGFLRQRSGWFWGFNGPFNKFQVISCF